MLIQGMKSLSAGVSTVSIIGSGIGIGMFTNNVLKIDDKLYRLFVILNVVVDSLNSVVVYFKNECNKVQVLVSQFWAQIISAAQFAILPDDAPMWCVVSMALVAGVYFWVTKKKSVDPDRSIKSVDHGEPANKPPVSEVVEDPFTGVDVDPTVLDQHDLLPVGELGGFFAFTGVPAWGWVWGFMWGYAVLSPLAWYALFTPSQQGPTYDGWVRNSRRATIQIYTEQQRRIFLLVRVWGWLHTLIQNPLPMYEIPTSWNASNAKYGRIVNRLVATANAGLGPALASGDRQVQLQALHRIQLAARIRQCLYRSLRVVELASAHINEQIVQHGDVDPVLIEMQGRLVTRSREIHLEFRRLRRVDFFDGFHTSTVQDILSSSRHLLSLGEDELLGIDA